ncbi:hypothetical protein [Ekhidna sp.]|uniref:hypothetical protein n=1 Tax=Ekhidna sp. TaxID=2608089 RepID=UPI003C7AA020
MGKLEHWVGSLIRISYLLLAISGFAVLGIIITLFEMQDLFEKWFDFAIPGSWEVNKNYVNGLLTVVTGLFTIAVPLSIQIVTSNVTENYRDRELQDSLYKESDYLAMKRVTIILILLTILSWIDISNSYFNLIALLITLEAIRVFMRFLKLIEIYSSDFLSKVLDHNKKIIDELL